MGADQPSGLSDFLNFSSKTATFMSIDVVGSTTLKSGEIEQDIIYTFLAYHKLVTQIAYQLHGQVMSISGDGIMLRFERAEDAVNAAQNLITLLSVGALLFQFSILAVLVLVVAAVPAFLAETKFSGEAFRLFRWRTPETRQQLYLETVIANDQYAKEVKLFGLGRRLLDRYVDIFHRLYAEDRALTLRRGFWGYVLGLVSTKVADLEPRDVLKRRIAEAARHMPLDRLCLGPQCGFASGFGSQPMTIAREQEKLRLVVDVAGEVWGQA